MPNARVRIRVERLFAAIRARSHRGIHRATRKAATAAALAGKVLTMPGMWRAESRLPGHLRSFVENARMSLSIRLGRTLVPEAALERRLLDALPLLMERTGSAAIGDYLEFGVYYGASMACMHRVLRTLHLDHVRLFGFDSFQGLPAEAEYEDLGAWRPGKYACSARFARRYLSSQQLDWSRAFLIEGWFQDTLTKETANECGLSHAGVIMVDADLSSSAAAALSFCAPLIRDACIILFDDWCAGGLDERDLGEKLAFDEFLTANSDLVADKLGGYSEHSEIFFLQRQAR